jgi:hypothetical protein|mmetsp:Transcript_29160/g.46999  ORF Transcript_29160/g.46999 Transcript_29160/m.46999 type:complete len:88 (-) Transcript_29160:94-357(-)
MADLAEFVVRAGDAEADLWRCPKLVGVKLLMPYELLTEGRVGIVAIGVTDDIRCAAAETACARPIPCEYGCVLTLAVVAMGSVRNGG